MSVINGVERRLRQPEYTGENRCTPCTVANIAIAGIASIVLQVIIGGQVGGVAAGLLFVGSLITIYFRGYLIPGTPTLTKRYFPNRVLAWFDKAPQDPITEIDVEPTLVDTGVLEPCVDRDDLCLDSAFKRAWYTRINSAEDDHVDVTPFMNSMERAAVDREAIELDRVGAAYVAFLDGTRVAQWESQTAFVADRAAVELLANRVENWERLGFVARTELAGALRLWLDQCPNCETPVSPGRDTVESCCRSVPVVAVECDRCDHRLFEVEFDAAEALA